MTSSDLDLAAIFPPVPTAFDEDGAIDFEAQARNLERWEAAPFGGYVVGGSNGEYVSQSGAERIEMVQFMRSHTARDRRIIAGSSMHSTRATLELTEAMAQAGADAVLVVTPSYYKSKMDHRTLVAFYTTIADQSPLPVLLYNVPANTGIDMPVETIVELSAHRNIIGVKDSSGNVAKIGEVCHRSRQGFQVLSGSASSLLGAIAMGAVGGVPALANIAPEQVCRILSLAREGDYESARMIQQPLIAVNNAVTVRYGVPGLKAALDMLGFYGGPPRPPLLPLEAGEVKQLRSILEGGGLL
ncbi:MAG: dihydrodipicolinate synthase family protein [Anaerolineales bacterium]